MVTVRGLRGERGGLGELPSALVTARAVESRSSPDPGPETQLLNRGERLMDTRNPKDSPVKIKGIKKIGEALYDIEFTIDGELPGDEGETIDWIEALKPQLPVVAPPKVGRNQPCPCGSGKKFKKCCDGKAA
ncbi:MAG TPA: SEC-C metal-binding domain-containing protein [Polyangiaceae bacterium]|nr:SEC-C metal-binding domain-containing protein [Polyangiaceae bacterium]